MKLVYQSYRTQNIPKWITTCLHSVKKWAEAGGYDYRFIDDEIFNKVPFWYSKKAEGNIQVITDLARLILAKEFLDSGYNTVVWMDADLLIIDPVNLDLSIQDSFSFCLETWMDQDLKGKVVYQQKVNNSISLFKKQNVFLDFYIDACLKILRATQVVEPVTVGTKFLSALHALVPLPLLRNVGILCPAIYEDVICNSSRYIVPYLELQGKVAAINLCGSKIGEGFNNIVVDDEGLNIVVSKLLKSKGLSSEYI